MRVLRSGLAILALLLTSAAGVVGSSTVAAVAQEGEPATVSITMNICADPGCTEQPEAVEPADGVVVEVANAADGTVFGVCTIGDTGPGTCTVDITRVETITLTVEETTIPAGYGLETNPIQLSGGLDDPQAQPEAIILLMPAEGFPPEDGGSQESQVTVNVNLCVAAGCTELPEAIEPAEGVGVNVTAEDGTAVGSCVTGETGPGTCAVPQSGADVVQVTIDASTVPAGYIADPNPTLYEGVAASGEIWLLLLPVDGFPPAEEDPQQVPSTPVVEPDAPAPEGMPAGLYAGRCFDDEPGELVVELNDVAMPEGEAAGSAEAIAAGAGFTLVPLSLDDILAVEDHAVAVYDEMDPDTLVACGAVGGVLDEQGALSIALTGADGSDITGVAYLAPRDDGQTGITIFVVPDTGEVETDATPVAGR
jgi:hypothetical protein